MLSLAQVSKTIKFDFNFSIFSSCKILFLLAVWERLQEGNPDFFEEYYKRCEVARQIAAFNDLLAQQVDLMHKLREIELSNVAPGN